MAELNIRPEGLKYARVLCHDVHEKPELWKWPEWANYGRGLLSGCQWDGWTMYKTWVTELCQRTLLGCAWDGWTIYMTWGTELCHKTLPGFHEQAELCIWPEELNYDRGLCKEVYEKAELCTNMTWVTELWQRTLLGCPWYGWIMYMTWVTELCQRTRPGYPW